MDTALALRKTWLKWIEIEYCRTFELAGIKNTLFRRYYFLFFGVMGGLRSWDEIADFGEGKIDWLRKYYPYQHGIPSHDTLNRVMSLLDHRCFEECFISWVSQGIRLEDGTIINIDRKKLRASAPKQEQQLLRDQGGKGAVHIVRAWRNEMQLCLGNPGWTANPMRLQRPKLLNCLDIEGCVITIDAIGCQKEIVKTICRQKADYVIGLKANKGKLEQAVTGLFDTAGGGSQSPVIKTRPPGLAGIDPA
jgi:hypothetical protein